MHVSLLKGFFLNPYMCRTALVADLFFQLHQRCDLFFQRIRYCYLSTTARPAFRSTQMTHRLVNRSYWYSTERAVATALRCIFTEAPIIALFQGAVFTQKTACDTSHVCQGDTITCIIMLIVTACKLFCCMPNREQV